MMTALVALIAVSAPVAAQQAPPAAQQPAAAPQPDAMKFDAKIAIVVNEVKPEKAADFEAVWTAIKAGLAASSKPELQQQAASLKMMKLATEVPAGSPALYVFSLDPVVTGVSYDPVKILFESGAFERAKADELYAKLKDAYNRISPWPLVTFGS
ncbi:MAG: hypothetical protein M3R55_08840 [Acidobacteriota bacterium]|nr:hypothetical protein [Acidobacteriota bacterium]